MSDTPEPTEHAAPDDQADLEGVAAKVVLRGPVDLVAAIPYLIGFRPAIGDLVILFTHQNRRVCTAIVQVGDAVGIAEAWAVTVAKTLAAEPMIDEARMIAYLDADATATLRALPRDTTPPLTDVLRVHEGRMWSMTCPAPGSCCPAEGIPLPPPPPDITSVFAVLHGTGALPERAGLADCLTPGPPPLVAQVQVSLDTLSASPDRQGAPADEFALLSREHEDRNGGPVPLPVPQAARLLLALQHPDVRDACMDWSDAGAWWLWTELIRHAPPGWVAPVATLIAVTAWQQGRPTQARMAAEHALKDTPGYALADLLLAVFQIGARPRSLSAPALEARRQLGISNVNPHAGERRPE